jgi:hypothetical protein
MKAYVIGLGMIDSSFTSAVQVYNQLKEYGLDVYFYEGTYGDQVEQIFAEENRVLHHTSFKGNPVDDDYRQSCMRLGVMACFHSHYRLWQHCVAINEPILIFEDDVIFERGWIPVEWQDVLLIATGKSVYQTDWYAENWSTNKESFDVKFERTSEDTLYISCMTAWSVPINFLKNLIKKLELCIIILRQNNK